MSEGITTIRIVSIDGSTDNDASIVRRLREFAWVNGETLDRETTRTRARERIPNQTERGGGR